MQRLSTGCVWHEFLGAILFLSSPWLSSQVFTSLKPAVSQKQEI